jgi:hypothetical protein
MKELQVERDVEGKHPSYKNEVPMLSTCKCIILRCPSTAVFHGRHCHFAEEKSEDQRN